MVCINRADWRELGTWTGKAARVLAAGAVVLSMGSLSALGQGTVALADEQPGKVTIKVPGQSQEAGHSTDANDADKVRYNAYRVFRGDVDAGADREGSKAAGGNGITNVIWESAAMRDVVVGFICKEDTSYQDPDDAGESALKAAEYIADHIGPNGGAERGNPNRDATLRLESSQFGSGLASTIRGAENIECTAARGEGTELQPGRAYSFDDGWYLFVTSTKSVEGSEDSRAGTSPIFAIVGGEDVEIAEKASVPTIDKQVKDDSSSGEDAWGMAADAHAGQSVAYRLIGTVADNIHSYDAYYYRFTDELSEGLAYDLASGKGHENGAARVYLHKAHDPNEKSASAADHSYDVTENFTFALSADGRRFDASADNLRSLAVNGKADPAYAMVAGDYLTLEYTARLVPDDSVVSEEQGTKGGGNVVQGATGNRNEAKVTYSNNPKTDSRGSSYGQDTRVYSYSLRLHKQDKQNASRALSGANFTLQVAKADDAESDGKYVQADGSLGEKAHEFSTDTGGNILVKNLDAGSYTLEETAAPPAEQASGNPEDRYVLLEPVTVVIGSNVHSDKKANGESYQSGNIRTKETAAQVLEVSTSVTSTDGSGRGSVAVAADSVDAAGTASGDGAHATPTAGKATGAQGADGTASVIVREAKETQMPLSGGAGIAGFAVVGGLAIAAGSALATRRRARGDAPDEKLS